MKRDIELIRKIILDIEKLSPGVSAWTTSPGHREKIFPDIGEDVSKDKLLAHVKMLIEGEFVEGHYVVHITDGPDCIVHDLTWEGHEFAANIRDVNIWNKAKSKAAEVSQSVSISVLSNLAQRIIEGTFS